MCDFASFLVNGGALNEDSELNIWVYDLESHSNCASYHGLAHDAYRECEWTADAATALIVRVEPNENADVLKDRILRRFATRNDFLLWAYPIAFKWVYNPNTNLPRGCTGLTKLDAPNAEYVYASGCTGLTKLDAPNAWTVDARGCTGLTKLDAPNAETVDASGCTGLTKLDAPNAKYVYASGCTGLTKLDAPNAKYV